MSVDVEDYFQVSAFAPHIRREDWDSLPCRVERNVDVLLACSTSADARATFFTLGWIAERYPQVVRASSTTATNSPATATATSAPASSRRANSATTSPAPRSCSRTSAASRCAATARRAFRSTAPTGGRSTELENAGYRYSSSIYPVRHDHYGMPDAPRFPHRPNGELRHSRDAAHHAPVRAQPAGGRRRLVPPAAVRDVALDAARVNVRRSAAGDLLLPSRGRSTPASRARRAFPRRRASAITSICTAPGGCANLLNDFEWDRVDRVFLGDA
jgi:polysaccharide deacetylase family protein (PEP-CTERM system associated)